MSQTILNRRVLVLFFLAASVLLIRSIQFHESITKEYLTSGELGLVGEVRNGHLYAKTVVERLYTGKRTAGYLAGLKPGDELVAIYNARGEGREIKNFYDLGEVWKTIGHDEPWSIRILRDGTPITLVVTPVPKPVKDLRFWFVTIMLVFGLPLLMLSVAFFLGFAKPEDDNAFLGSLFFISFSFVFGVQLNLFPPILRDFAVLLSVICISFAGYLFAQFFLLFPARSILLRKLPWLSKALLVVTICFCVLNAAATYFFYSSFARYEQALKWIQPLTPFLGFFQVFIVAIGLISLVLHFLKAETMDERRKTGILLAGAFIGVVPLAIFLTIYSRGSSAPPPFWVIATLAISIGFFPLSFLYVVLRHRVLGIRLIVRRGLQYALVSRGFFVIEGLLIFAIIYLALSALRIFNYTEVGLIGIFVLAAAAFGISIGMRQINESAMGVIDRRFFRHAYNTQQVLTELARGVRRLAAQRELLFDLITDKLSDALLPDKVAVFLRDENTDAFGCHGIRVRSGYHDEVWSGAREYSGDCFVSDSLIGRQLMRFRTEEPECLEIYLNDPKSWAFALMKVDSSDQQYQEKLLIEKMNTKLIVPLVSGEQILGFMSLGEKLSEEAYSKEDKQLLLSVAEQAAIALEYSQLITRVAEQETMKRELQIATEVQARLFPQTQPEMRTLEYTGYCKAARAVGGDYYDFLPFEGRSLGLALGDVSGKGISSALLMANLQALLRSAAPLRGDQVDKLMNDINRLLCASTTTHKYATLFYCVYDDDTRRLTYVNAGHNPPMLFRAQGGVERLTTGGLVAGMLPDVVYQRDVVDLQPGDVLLIYSDGLSEAMDLNDNEFGEERLMQTICENLDASIEEIRDRILKEVSVFVGDAPQHDDLTLVIARVT